MEAQDLWAMHQFVVFLSHCVHDLIICAIIIAVKAATAIKGNVLLFLIHRIVQKLSNIPQIFLKMDKKRP